MLTRNVLTRCWIEAIRPSSETSLKLTSCLEKSGLYIRLCLKLYNVAILYAKLKSREYQACQVRFVESFLFSFGSKKELVEVYRYIALS